ncbi:MAG TPA: hypothetical protein VD929_04755 [Caulobacteraceae bacterium]|nr:hypothetical protein [Caulobacteraceae bacterium]
MRLVTAFTLTLAAVPAVAFAAAVATVAHAQPSTASRLSDAEYVALARCTGLTAATGEDVSQLKALLKVQKRGRSMYVEDRADHVRSEAQGLSAADAAAQRDAACAAFKG